MLRENETFRFGTVGWYMQILKWREKTSVITTATEFPTAIIITLYK